MRNALCDGRAKSTIEGLSRSGDCYGEAIASLLAQYDRPRLIHQAHVCKIIEATPLKEGNGRELCRLHNTAQQHLQALKAMGHDLSDTFITSVLELKLDQTTTFEWHKCSLEYPDVPPYQKLLEFLDLRAQASETLTTETVTVKKQNKGEHKKTKMQVYCILLERFRA